MIGVDQPCFLASQSLELGLQLLELGLLLRVTLQPELRDVLPFQQQTLRVTEQLADVRPDGRFQFLASRRPLRTDRVPSTQDAIFAMAFIVATLRLLARCLVGCSVHRQATGLIPIRGLR